MRPNKQGHYTVLTMASKVTPSIKSDRKKVKNGHKRSVNRVRYDSGPEKPLPKYVLLKNGKWHVRRHFPTPDKQKNGAIRYTQIIRVVPDETEESARLVSDAIEAMYRAAAAAPADGETLADFIRHYKIAKKNSVSRRTFEAIEDYLTRLLPASLNLKPIDKITPIDIQRLYNSLDSSPSTLQKFHKTLSTVFNQAVTWDVIPKNPCKGSILPRSIAPEKQAFDPKQAQRFIRECRKADDNILLEFLLETGLRPSEALALTWNDINFKKLAVSITKALVTGLKGGGYEIKEPKTRSSIRVVHISSQIAERLSRQKELIEDLKRELTKRIRAPVLLSHMRQKGINYRNRKLLRKNSRERLNNLNNLNLVFPSETGAYQAVGNVNRRDFQAVLARAKLKGFTLYSLRHSCFSLMLAGGTDIKTVSQKAGHSTVQMTYDRYIHILQSMEKTGTNVLAETLYGEL